MLEVLSYRGCCSQAFDSVNKTKKGSEPGFSDRKRTPIGTQAGEDMSTEQAVGVIGLGAMGMGVARSLLRAGFTVTGCDVRNEALKEFAGHGGTPTTSPAEAGRNASFLVIVVVNAEQTENVLFGEDGAAATLAPGSVVLACATVPSEFAIATAERLARQDIEMIDAPISGGAVRAAAGELSVMASGPPATFDKAKDVLDAMAETVHRLGDTVGPGSAVKTINQLLAGVHIAAGAEALALAMRMGLDPKVVYDVICASAGSSWMFENRMPHVLAGDYTPFSAVNIFVKDLGIVLETGKQLTFPLPIAATAHQQYLAASGAGYGRQDDSAVIKVYRDLGGITLPEKSED